MVFVAAGMGGGTGSGAGPLLAKMAKEKGKLTVGVVTLPFLFEKTPRIITALDAVEEMNKNVDALIVINNESLKLFYSEECLIDAFKKPDEILAMAVKSIAEIITVKGMINRDFEDVKTTMENSGVALVSYGFGQGENRLDDAITNALKSPLLNNNDIYNAKRVLFYISLVENSDFKTAELTKHMDAFMARFDNHIKMIWGFGIDKSLKPEQEVKFTIIATGFSIEAVPKMKERICERTKDNADKREEDDKRVEIVYGPIDVDVNKVKIKRVQQSSIIVLTMDEMDNDDLITFMEGSPTHSRTQKEMEKIRKPASIIATSERQTGKLSVSDTEEIITFTF
jgi:cell division protein FtsZ